MNTKSSDKDLNLMKTNLSGIASHFYKNITVNDVLKEAVMNSIQANATDISINLQYEYQKTLDGEASNLGNLHSIIIKDNGEGLTEKNINAFLEVATENKKNIGGKGLGRISFLKLASNIKIESISCEKKHIEFHFTFDTEEHDIKISDSIEIPPYTKIILSDLNLKHPKTQAASCVNFVKEKFNLMFFLKQQEAKKQISIKFLVNSQLIDEIKSNDIHCLKKINYTNNECEFTVYAFQNKEKQGIRIYYCANNIQVKPIVISENFHTQYMFAITSNFFDISANPERTQFDFQSNDEPTPTDIFSATPNNNFEKELKQICMNIIHENEPNLKKENQDKLNKLKEKYGYINFDDVDANDLNFNEKDIIEAYRKKINQKEDRLVMLLDKPDISADELVDEVTEQNKHELAKYIFHRDLVAKKGLSLTNSKENEDVLHNLFFPQRASVNTDKELEHNKKHLYQNCIWLLDDKFMTYAYIASDVTMSRIFDEMETNNSSDKGKKRPDLFILYNAPESSELHKDVVLIEFKKGNIDYKEQIIAIEQVAEYKRAAAKVLNNISNFYCYVICDFDEKNEDIKTTMEDKKFTRVFSNNGCMYYGYLGGSKVHLTFVSSNSIFADAVARNKTFLHILTSNS